MTFFFSKLFWGGLLICWGVILILERLLQVNIPFGRFLVAFLLIYAGIYLLTRHNKPNTCFPNLNIFTERTIVSDGSSKEFNVVFGSNVIDLTQHRDYSEPITINTVFGSSTVYLSPNETYEFRLNTVFGGTDLPDKREFHFGSNNVILGDKESPNKIRIEVNTVFGSTEMLFKKQ